MAPAPLLAIVEKVFNFALSITKACTSMEHQASDWILGNMGRAVTINAASSAITRCVHSIVSVLSFEYELKDACNPKAKGFAFTSNEARHGDLNLNMRGIGPLLKLV